MQQSTAGGPVSGPSEPQAAAVSEEEAFQATHETALANIRRFLSETSAYTILPESFRLIVLDNNLTVKGALGALTSNSKFLFHARTGPQHHRH